MPQSPPQSPIASPPARHRHRHRAARRPIPLVLALTALALMAGAATPTFAEPAIEQRIEAQREEIESTEQERAAAREALAKLQKRMAFLEEKSAELDAERRELEARQRTLDRREAELRDGLAQRRAELERRLQAAYPLTRGSVLQALLGDGDALQTDRDLHYLRALIRPVQEARRALERQRVELAENRTAIAETDRELRDAGTRLDRHYEEVGKNLTEQQRLLASLGETLDKQQRDLKGLLDRKRRLDREVAAARKAAEEAAKRADQERREAEQRAERERTERLARQESEPPGTTPPAQVRDDGSIPITGRIERRFGETLPQGRLRNDGVIFHADGASAVRAVDGGRVAFAGTLKGWGQLVMLRHDGDFLSLYAHCRSLDVAKGDRVERGDRLCTSGVIDAGQEGLYVEVRRGNRPVDPGRWPAWRQAVGG
ncbi:peptidoglycan DD-metalloendopeptidase family protein [Guyparkeria halophila]|uniref:Peptidoglycan DD-metalloendopeptidase family protein n=1 Tax=Guyparkeria halophila TaxID=47960 RepID=A0A6I6D7L0_9GAMM|nr:peptidoglycan DD-metalloendopeptidase family protein [Guyparkeria halophila]QGT79481.1 peptidoglycan DD-metalloendopeptidase family protein [Guyparkeria halophila]